jgi:hypothetical protein
MNLRKLFHVKQSPVSVIDVFKADPTPPSAWSRLEALGYTFVRGVTRNGKTEYAFFLGDEMVSDEWSKPLTIHESLIMREAWAAARLEALKE